MGAKETYWQKLQRPEWQRKRLEKFKEADWHCESCGDKETQLHVHHKHYIKGREPWDYDNTQLAVLCKNCHEVQHDEMGFEELMFHEVIGMLPVDGPANRSELAWLLMGYVGISMDDLHARVAERCGYAPAYLHREHHAYRIGDMARMMMEQAYKSAHKAEPDGLRYERLYEYLDNFLLGWDGAMFDILVGNFTPKDIPSEECEKLGKRG